MVDCRSEFQWADTCWHLFGSGWSIRRRGKSCIICKVFNFGQLAPYRPIWNVKEQYTGCLPLGLLNEHLILCSQPFVILISKTRWAGITSIMASMARSITLDLAGCSTVYIGSLHLLGFHANIATVQCSECVKNDITLLIWYTSPLLPFSCSPLYYWCQWYY